MNSERARPLAPRHFDNLSDGTQPPDGKVLSIGNVAETFGISRWLLQFCELRGLIGRRNRIGKTPVYSWADCERLVFIIKCRRAGLRFSEIASVVQAVNDESARVHEAGQELCMALVEKLEGRRKMVDEALAELAHAHAQLGAKLCGDAEPHPVKASGA
jgi:DNA-binding transcriptional MerR regulator